MPRLDTRPLPHWTWPGRRQAFPARWGAATVWTMAPGCHSAGARARDRASARPPASQARLRPNGPPTRRESRERAGGDGSQERSVDTRPRCARYPSGPCQGCASCRSPRRGWPRGWPRRSAPTWPGSVQQSQAGTLLTRLPRRPPLRRVGHRCIQLSKEESQGKASNRDRSPRAKGWVSATSRLLVTLWRSIPTPGAPGAGGSRRKR